MEHLVYSCSIIFNKTMQKCTGREHLLWLFTYVLSFISKRNSMERTIEAWNRDKGHKAPNLISTMPNSRFFPSSRSISVAFYHSNTS